MTERERGRIARDIGYEAACGVTDNLIRKSTHDDGTVDVGVYFAALGFAANTLMAQLNADQMLNAYPQAVWLGFFEDVDE